MNEYEDDLLKVAGASRLTETRDVDHIEEGLLSALREWESEAAALDQASNQLQEQRANAAFQRTRLEAALRAYRGEDRATMLKSPVMGGLVGVRPGPQETTRY